MTVGLIRSESGRDLRTLAATGAAGGTRRTITAATAGGLALLGVVIGITVAYAAIIAAFLDDLDGLGRVPLAHLTITAIGVPLAATVFGWLLAGREPTSLGHAAA